jgi:hypothetical protein
MIKIITDATCCDEWGGNVTKMLEERKEGDMTVPEYIWSFFDLSNGYNYVRMRRGIPQKIPWIQKQMTEDRLVAITERMKTFEFNHALKVREGKSFVTDGMALEDKENMEAYYDTYTESTSWAVLSLFVHRTIRKVGKGEEADNRYCYWPLSQPWVNHRPIDLNLIDGKNGYIESLSKETNLVWSSQQGFSVPYCVSNEAVGEDDKIDIEFMINSGESKTNADEYVQDKTSNSAAGNVHCVKVDKESLNKCINTLKVSCQP